MLDVVLKAAEEAGVLGPLQAHLAALEQEADRLRHDLGKWRNAAHHARLGAETLISMMDDGQPVTVVVLAEWRLTTLRQDVSDAESRGYERAREQAAGIMERWPGLRDDLFTGEYEDASTRAARRIRAMTDERAGEAPVVEQRDPTTPRREFMQVPPETIKAGAPWGFCDKDPRCHQRKGHPPPCKTA